MRWGSTHHTVFSHSSGHRDEGAGGLDHIPVHRWDGNCCLRVDIGARNNSLQSFYPTSVMYYDIQAIRSVVQGYTSARNYRWDGNCCLRVIATIVRYRCSEQQFRVDLPNIGYVQYIYVWPQS